MAPVKKELRPLGRTFITERREAAGMTQEQFAEKIDISRSTLSKIETGESPYTQRTLEAMADALGCQPGDLLTGSTMAKPVRGKEQIAALMRRIDGLSEENVQILISIALSYLPADAQYEQSQDRDQLEPATRRRAEQPSR